MAKSHCETCKCFEEDRYVDYLEEVLKDPKVPQYMKDYLIEDVKNRLKPSIFLDLCAGKKVTGIIKWHN